MALLTKLTIQDVQNEYLVVGFHCTYSRQHNRYVPTSRPTCDQIEITVVAPEKDDFLFYEWFIEQSTLTGKITYELPVTSKNAYPEVRSIGFTDARCLSFTEHYDVNSMSRRLITIVIVPEEVKIDDVEVKHL